MSFPWLHQKISLRASIVAIGVALAVTIVCLQICLSIYENKINGDTPAICRLYLEQNPMVHEHFGALQEELFLKGESAVLVDDPNSGKEGLYTFRVTGSIAKGTLKMIWAREAGDGALTVTAISITDVWIEDDGTAFITGIEEPGRLRDIIPGKVVVMKSSDYKTWDKIAVDYRASAIRPMLAMPDPQDRWMATDNGMILKLVAP